MFLRSDKLIVLEMWVWGVVQRMIEVGRGWGKARQGRAEEVNPGWGGGRWGLGEWLLHTWEGELRSLEQFPVAQQGAYVRKGFEP